jgi:hypothetical protein
MSPEDKALDAAAAYLFAKDPDAVSVSISITKVVRVTSTATRTRTLEATEALSSATEPETAPDQEAVPEADEGHDEPAQPHPILKGPVLTRQQASEIKAKLARGERNCSLATYYRCSNELISGIRHGRIWRSA